MHLSLTSYFFFTEPAPTEIYTLSLHDALPISRRQQASIEGSLAPRPRSPVLLGRGARAVGGDRAGRRHRLGWRAPAANPRSEEHTSELQSHSDLVCRLLLEKKNENSMCDAA